MIEKLSSLLKNFKVTQKFYLLYGSNNGQIDETINNVFKPKLSKNIFTYDENEIILNTDEFEENILNKSFFDNEKLIIINRASDKILEIIKNLIEKDISEVVIIIKANILEKKSKLRVFFEKNEKTICVAFYEDNHQSLMNVAHNFLSKNEIKISQQIINHIIETSRKNRISLINELEKIKIFYNKKNSINFDDILKLTKANENYNVTELTDQCLVKNKKKIISIMNENIPSVEDNILILKSFLFKLKRLKKLKPEIQKQKNQDQVISSFKPPIFWKDKDIIKQQLRTLSLDEINSFIKKVNKIELMIKKNATLSNVIINNFILETIDYPSNLI